MLQDGQTVVSNWLGQSWLEPAVSLNEPAATIPAIAASVGVKRGP